MSLDVAREPSHRQHPLARVGLLAAGLALLAVGAVTIGAGAGEYPLWSRPGLRFVLLEAGPPILAGAVALATWPRAGIAPPRLLRFASLVVLAALLVRAGRRVILGAAPLGLLEASLLTLVLIFALWSEVAAARTLRDE